MTATALARVVHEQTIAVVPIAAVEQHGPHMPTGTDAILCTAIAEAVEQALPEQIVLTPTVWLGASAHHLRLGATLNSELTTYVATLCDLARSLLEDGTQRLLLLNGHGGNIDPMRIALRQLQPMYPQALLAAGCYWSVADELRAATLEGEHSFVGHACEFETSLMLHLRPDLVDERRVDAGPLIPDQIDGLFIARDMRQRTQAGYTGRPDLASPSKGKRLFEGIVTRLTAAIQRLLTQPQGTEYQDLL
jgi:creatinine amidohydrolase